MEGSNCNLCFNNNYCSQAMTCTHFKRKNIEFASTCRISIFRFYYTRNFPLLLTLLQANVKRERIHFQIRISALACRAATEAAAFAPCPPACVLFRPMAAWTESDSANMIAKPASSGPSDFATFRVALASAFGMEKVVSTFSKAPPPLGQKAVSATAMALFLRFTFTPFGCHRRVTIS